MWEPIEVHCVKRCSRDVKEVIEAENQGFSAGAQEAKIPSPHSKSSKRRILPRPSDLLLVSLSHIKLDEWGRFLLTAHVGLVGPVGYVWKTANRHCCCQNTQA